MRHTRVQTPRGVKDILPREAMIKSRMEREAAAFLEQWGYERVVTPTFEYYDALKQGDGPVLADQLYRFVDRDGTTLALRPEMTTPIARLVATRYRSEHMPLRLYYVGSVFRYDEPQAGRHREFTQIGGELVGANGRKADAEVVTLAVGLMKHLGLRSFRLDLGHVDYFLGVVEGVSDRQLARQLRQALLDRDYVRYEQLVAESPLSLSQREVLKKMPVLRGNTEHILTEGRVLAQGMPRALRAIDELEAVYRLATAYGLQKHVGIDLGMMKDLDYYSGLQIEGYVPELGFTLCTGGRYDHLIGKYGWDCPARGFAFGVERAMLALARQGQARDERSQADVYLFTSSEEDEHMTAALFQTAAALRSRGVTVVLDLAEGGEKARSAEEIRAMADKGNARLPVELKSADGATVEMHGDERRTLTVDELARWVKTSSEEAESEGVL